MNVEYYIPQKLTGLVDRIWEHRISEANRWTILPSGKIELIFNISNSASLIGSKKMSPDDNPLGHFVFMSGLHTHPLTMSFDKIHHIGIRMHPLALNAFFSVPGNKIRDYYLPGSEIFQTHNQIEDKLCSNEPFQAKAQWLEDFLYARINETPELHFALQLSEVVEKFIKQNGSQPKRTIEDLIGYSRTHTFRIFNEWFGISAHSYQKLLRFVQSIHAMHNSSNNLTMIGMNSEYYDQAHFIRSFKAFAGITPGDYRKHMTCLPGQIPG